jgi:hypothetical protein
LKTWAGRLDLNQRPPEPHQKKDTIQNHSISSKSNQKVPDIILETDYSTPQDISILFTLTPVFYLPRCVPRPKKEVNDHAPDGPSNPENFPQKIRFELADGNGLSLRVMPSGSKCWVFRYRFEGIPRRMTLGIYPPFQLPEKKDYHILPGADKLPFLTLAGARKTHVEAMNKLSRGIDPAAEQKAARGARQEAPTFEEFLKEFWQEELQAKKSGPETLRRLKKDILPAWGRRKVADINRREIILLLDGIQARAPITANRIVHSGSCASE